MHQQKIIFAGKKLGEAKKALVMIHGRGGSAEDVLSLANHLDVKDYVLAAPQATNNSWYPNSFLAPPEVNEPYLSSALELIDHTVKEIVDAGIDKDHIYFLGFSQGACLSLEYVTRNATKYGGVVAFTGGLIGDKIYPQNYKGNFAETPVFIGTSNPDPHVPVARVHASTNILKDMHAEVTEKVYTNMGHTINQDEIDLANKLVFNK
ncbi:dienelactone hydrolase family protein [soil metagenome]